MTMDEKTIKATQGAWEKWDKIYQGKAIDRGAANCPLCKLFLLEDCIGCPIFNATGEYKCGGSPYNPYTSVVETCGKDSLEAREASLAFRNFINLLLPPERRMPKRRAKP